MMEIKLQIQEAQITLCKIYTKPNQTKPNKTHLSISYSNHRNQRQKKILQKVRGKANL